MEYDPPSIPEKPNSDTPEAIWECLEYKAAIEQQLNDWCDTLKSSHPAVRIGGIARIIVSNCTPRDRPTDEIEGNPFQTGLTPKEAEHLGQKWNQLTHIATIAQDDSLDTIPTRELSADVLNDYFERIILFTNETDSPQATKDAVQYLRRLHRADERLSQKLLPHKEATSQNTRYVLLLNRILDDLN